ncbi:MAG: hypothetical protein JXR56_04130, partial [Candidatus Cloacimonetes bacterium]|nr:hypothetical protein [Candidatus Cloacimonadota bacterium]
MKKITVITLLLVLMVSLCAQTKLTNIRFGNYTYGTRVVFETDGKADYQISDGDSEVKVLIYASLADETLKNVSVGAKNIVGMKFSETDDYTQITFQAKSLYRSIGFPLSGKPYKIVVDILFATGGYNYATGLGVARYLYDLSVTGAAEAEFEKLEEMYPNETGFYYYYGLNKLRLKETKKAEKFFLKVSEKDAEYSKATAELKKLGVQPSVAEKPKEKVVKTEPVVEPITTSEEVIEEEMETIVPSVVDTTSTNNANFFRSPFWYLTLALLAIIVLSTIYFLIQRGKLK